MFLDQIMNKSQPEAKKFKLKNLYIVAYLVSAIAYKYHDGNKSIKFIDEGLKYCEMTSAGAVSEHRDSSYLDWLQELKTRFLLHKSHIYMIQYKLNDSFQLLKACMKNCDQKPPIWMKLSEQILLSWALLFRTKLD